METVNISAHVLLYIVLTFASELTFPRVAPYANNIYTVLHGKLIRKVTAAPLRLGILNDRLSRFTTSK